MDVPKWFSYNTDFEDSLQLATPKLCREVSLKVLVLGDIMVGKTSLVHRYVKNSFKHHYKGTIGVDFTIKSIQWSEELTIKVQFWDIAGTERFNALTRAYYKNANGSLVLFDLGDVNSFNSVVRWKEDLDSKCRLPDGSGIPCLLLANKCDLPAWAVWKDMIEAASFHNGFVSWREVSAKDNIGVDEALRYLIEQMLMKSRVHHEGSIQLNEVRLELKDLALDKNQDKRSLEKFRCC